MCTRLSPPVKPNAKPYPKPKEGETLYNTLRDFIGAPDDSESIKSGNSLSENTHKKFAEIVTKKRRKHCQQ